MATKMSAGVMTKDKFCDLVTELRKADAKKDAAVGECRAIRKRMKSQGVDLDALSLMQSLAKLEPDDAAARIKNLWRYREWNGDGVQLPLPLFGADDDERDDDAPSSAVVDAIHDEAVAVAMDREAQAAADGAPVAVPPAVKRASTRRQMAEPNAPVH